MRPKNLDCFIYLRKSRRDLEEERKRKHTVSPEEVDILKRHRARLLELAKSEGHNIVDIFEEVASGEAIADRPKVQELLRRLDNNEVDAVLVMDLDRLGRGDMVDMGQIFRTLRNTETLIITPTEVIDPNDESSELIYGVKSILSREELKIITNRMQRGRRASVLEGRHISRKPPYGYIRDENLRLLPDPETAWVVEYIFRRMTENVGRVQIAQELDKMGIKPPDGGAKGAGKSYWSPSTISAIIKNEVYIGNLVWGKYRTIKQNGKRIRRKVPEEEWIRYNNAHPPIVTEELFKQANEAHSRRWRPPTKHSKGLRNPLAGILYCAVCGHAMAWFPRYGKRRDNIRCKQPTCKGVQAGAVFAIVEEAILNGLEEIIGEFEFEEGSTNNTRIEAEISQYENQLKQKRSHLATLQEQKDTLHELLEQKVYDVETFIERSKVVNEKIKNLNENINHLEVKLHEAREKQNKQNNYAPRVKRVLEEYRNTDDIDKKNRLLKSVIEKATYRRKPEWKDSLDHFEIHIYPLI